MADKLIAAILVVSTLVAVGCASEEIRLPMEKGEKWARSGWPEIRLPEEEDCHNICPGKNSWPELVGKNGKKAAAVIEKENPFVNAIVIKDGTPVTRDFRCDRVWVWVDDECVVLRTPIIT